MSVYSWMIGPICTLLGVLVAYAALRRNVKQDTENDGRETGMVFTELGYIKGGIDDLKTENREQRKVNTEIVTRITAVEASAKQAHKRIDALEGRKERE